jgi:hypothetical protein
VGMKRQGRETDYSRPSCAEVNIGEAMYLNSLIFPYCVVFNYMVNYRANFSYLIVSGY